MKKFEKSYYEDIVMNEIIRKCNEGIDLREISKNTNLSKDIIKKVLLKLYTMKLFHKVKKHKTNNFVKYNYFTRITKEEYDKKYCL